MRGVLGFFTDPVATLSEIQPVLRQGERLVLQETDPDLRGTPAAPEPTASQLHFCSSDELERLACDAWFGDVQVVRRELGSIAREAGIPQEHLSLFSGSPERFLLARRD